MRQPDHGKIERLEAVSRELDTAPEAFQEWLRELGHVATRFLGELPDRPAYRAPSPSMPERVMTRSGAFGETASPLTSALAELDDRLAHGIDPTSGRFFGYVPGGGIPTAAVGDFLAALTNRYSGIHEASPGAADIENQIIGWLIGVTGLPDGAWGSLQSGGSLSAMTAMVVARDTRPAGRWGRGVIYLTEECHHSLVKSLHIVGLGGMTRRHMRTDRGKRMEVSHLEESIAADRAAGLEPWIVAASAGTVNTGSIDPLADIAAVCRAHDLWMHVDGAYGGFFTLVGAARSRLAGFELADSLVLDPHKGLFQPYGVGAVLVRDGEALRRSFCLRASYLVEPPPDAGRSPADYSAELTRHFRGLRLWLSLTVHGVARFRAALEEKLELAVLAHQALAALDALELFMDPDLTILAFRARDPAGDERTARLLETMLARGRVHLTPTRLDGRMWIRLCILSFRSHRAEVELALDEIRAALAGLRDPG